MSNPSLKTFGMEVGGSMSASGRWGGSNDDGVNEKAKEQIIGALRVSGQGENIIGLCGPDKRTAFIVETTKRIAEREQLFQQIVITGTKNLDITMIQTKIGEAIGLNFDDKTNPAESTSRIRFGKNKRMACATTGRAGLLCAKMKELQTVLVVLLDLQGSLDLGEIGIPFGADHNGCKILLTSTSLEVLSNQMMVHKLIQL